MSRLTVAIVILFIGSCKSTYNSNCSIALQNIQNVQYNMSIPCDYISKKKIELERGKELFVVVYKDSSRIFFSNEATYAPSFSLKFLSSKQTGAFIFNDSIIFKGRNDRNWKIQKINNYILGYYNVPDSLKVQYDYFISSLRVK